MLKAIYSAIRSKICQEGKIDKYLSSLLSLCVGGVTLMLCIKLVLVSITPLGSAVVPEV
ncbi:hypothetical protein ES705_39833 [subsurface metagenome]